MRYKYLIFILLGFFLLSFVSAFSVEVSTNTITQTIKQGESFSVTVTYIINNTDQTAINYNINPPSSIPFMTSTKSSIIIPPNTKIEETVTFIFSPTTSNEVKSYIGIVSIGYQQIGIIINVEADQTGDCQINPSLVSYTQSVKQGTTFELPKITFNPENCVGGFVISSPYISGGVQTNEGQKPVFVKSVINNVVTLGVDTIGLPTDPYTTSLTLTAFGKTFSDISNINIIVTGGTSPYTNLSITKLPTCSLSASEFVLNQTYKLTCNNIEPGIDIHPIIDDNYIKGLNAKEEGTSYVYYFQPIQFGNTVIKARFLYKNAPIGKEYSQEVRILAGSGVVPGTSLALRFYPPLYEAQEDELITIRAVDNKSGNILTNAVIYLDGIELTNDTLTLKSNKNYEIRVSFIGYSDLVETININPKLIKFTINPEYNLGDSLNFTTDPEDATISLDGDLITLPFSLNEIGTFQITIGKLGYTTSTQNITVGVLTKIIYSTPLDDLEKGGEVLVEFEKNDTVIYVDFQADPKDPSIILVEEFTGKEVRFDTKDFGVYHVYAEGQFIQQFSIEPGSKWYKSYWLWVPLILILIGLFIYFGWMREDSDDEIPRGE